MKQSEIMFVTIREINGCKHLQERQVEDLKAYVRYLLNLEDTDENNNVIVDAIKLYFEQQNRIRI